MRTAWRFWPGINGYDDSGTRDLALRGERVFYVWPTEAGCIDKSSGRLLWRHPFVALKVNESATRREYDWWKIAVDDRLVYTVEGRWSGNPTPSAYHLLALHATNGTPAWQYSMKAGASGAPCSAGRAVLLPLDDGTVLAVDRETGKPVWRKRLTATSAGDMGIILQPTGGIFVAQIGSGRIAGFRIRDGAQVWSYPKPGTVHDDGRSDGFSVERGIVYAFLSASQLVAIDAATGRLLWSRTSNGSGTPSPDVLMVGDLVVTDPFGQLAAVRKRGGRSVRFHDPHIYEYRRSGPMSMPWQPNLVHGHPARRQLFETLDGLPLVNGVPTKLRSIWAAGTLALLDANTGRETWRWQPEDGITLDQIISDGRKLFISDGSSIRAVEPGASPRLPRDPARRKALARWMVTSLFRGYDAYARLNHGWEHPGAFRSQKEPPSSDEAILTLVRLGGDSLPALMREVRHDVAERDKRIPAADDLSYRITNLSDSLSKEIDLLTDIGDRASATGLMGELRQAKDPISRMLLAQGLIRLGDPRAFPALLEFARTQPNDPNTQRDALYLARNAPNRTALRNEVTAFLLSALADKSAPAWLPLFARFELLNGRGEGARRAALAAFVGERTARLMPREISLTATDGPVDPFGKEVTGLFPTQIHIMATAQDRTGKRWGVFLCDYLGDSGDLWFAQSADGKLWTHPTFAMSLQARCAPTRRPGAVSLHCVGDTMIVRWQEVGDYLENVAILHVERLPIADIDRDSDRDGLNDLLEKEIGTDPHNADTNGNGIPDGLDKNAAVVGDARTDEEGIFQAAVEALCQVGRDGEPRTKPRAFGGSPGLLVLRRPPGSHGVRILGHTGPVVFRALTRGDSRSTFQIAQVAPGRFVFTPPHIDLAGIYHDQTERRLAEDTSLSDPFAGGSSAREDLKSASFRDYFPYQRSPNGDRARVGWEQCIGNAFEPSVIGFDVETRKIDGRWYPVECRLIFASGRHWNEEVVIPSVGRAARAIRGRTAARGEH